MLEYLTEFLKKKDVEYKRKLKLSEVSPIRIGGVAELAVYPDTPEKFIFLAGLLKREKIKYKIVGRMSNILPSDGGYSGVVLKTDRLADFEIYDSVLRCDAGCSLPFIGRRSAEYGYSGFEELSGIPGSVGGAVVGNAGAFGREISDILIDAEVFDTENGARYTLSREELGFAYRHSRIKGTTLALLSARFGLEYSTRDAVLSNIEKYASIRRRTQPVGIPSLGSTFKRPSPDIFAARLIDECGIKGTRIGGAEISKKHAGFIVNTGGATANDYKVLADYARRSVRSRFSVDLELEVELLS